MNIIKIYEMLHLLCADWKIFRYITPCLST